MRRHRAIFLAEPPAVGFEEMLTGTRAVGNYPRPIDMEYPEPCRKMRYLLRKIKAEGKAIFQVEPYLEVLLGIHEFFSQEMARRFAYIAHLRDELICIHITSRLLLNDCRPLFA